MIFGFVLLGLFFQGCDSPPPPMTAKPAPATQSAPAESPPVDRQIRILLLDGVQTASILIRDRYNLIDAESGEILRLDEPPGELAVVFSQTGIDVPALDVRAASGTLDVVPTGDKPTQIKLSEEWKDFPGGVRFLLRPDGGAVINLMDMEDYLLGVVSSELSGNFHREAFRAQAIAARTYAWYSRQTTGLRRDWDVWATEKSQVYSGLERQKLVPQAAQAVRDTRGIVCTWPSPSGEKIFCTYYSSRCGGTTTSAPSPGGGPPILPLAGGVECEYCSRPDAYRWPQEPRIFRWQIGERLANRYARFENFSPIERVEVAEASPEGRALRVAVTNIQGRTLELDAENFRLTVDPSGRILQSTWFTITNEPDGAVVFSGGRGMGHGMGMCQYGADALARAGWDVASILRHYYPGSRLARAY